MIKLSSIDSQKDYTIVYNTSTGLLKERLLSIGFIKDSTIRKINNDKQKSMNIYLIKGMMIALRQEEADYVWVK